MTMAKVAIDARVSTNKDQTVDNQLLALRDWAAARGHVIAGEFTDQGISGAKGRDKRPGLDTMMRAAVRGEFDMIAATALDRLGRSMQHLVRLLGELDALHVGLYIQNMAMDTTTPMGKLMYNVMGAFAEFERGLIRERTMLGLERARRRGKRLGRPKIAPAREQKITALLTAGTSINRVRRLTGASMGAIYSIKQEMREAEEWQAAANTTNP